MMTTSKNIITCLQDFGLTDNEVALYLASLSLGEMTMTVLAKRANLKRSTAYLTFQFLEKKGLMGSYKMRGVLRFIATDPEILLKKTQSRYQTLSLVLPELKAQQRTNKSKITYFEGKEGYHTVMEDILRYNNIDLYHHGSLYTTWKVVDQEYDINYFMPARIKNRIRLKCLYYPEEIKKVVEKRNSLLELRQVKAIPQEFYYPSSMLIYENKVAIFTSPKELITVLIESTDIAENEKRKFDHLWSLS